MGAITKFLAWWTSTPTGRAFLKYLAGKAWEVIKVLWNDYVAARYKKKRAAEQAKGKEEFDKVHADPNATPDDRGKAYEKRNNSGR